MQSLVSTVRSFKVCLKTRTEACHFEPLTGNYFSRRPLLTVEPEAVYCLASGLGAARLAIAAADLTLHKNVQNWKPKPCWIDTDRDFSAASAVTRSRLVSDGIIQPDFSMIDIIFERLDCASWSHTILRDSLSIARWD
jgi:hypothetical protein